MSDRNKGGTPDARTLAGARSHRLGARGEAPLMVRRRRRRGDEEEVHGSWKIAYADFVTAMMAFFLLMWLINVTDEKQRKEMSEYFNPYQQEQQPRDDGKAPEEPRGILSILTGVFGAAPGEDRDAGRAAPAPEAPGDGDNHSVSKAEYERFEETRRAAEEEQRQLDSVREEIRRTVERMPDLRALADNLMIEEVPEGLRIQIVDKDDFSMFQIGSTTMNPRARMLVAAIAKAVGSVPNRIAVSGHTDGLRYSGRNRYSNWELSADRANAARRELADTGVDEGKFARVEGLADTDHLVKDRPEDQRNRRISILVLRRHPAQDGPPKR